MAGDRDPHQRADRESGTAPRVNDNTTADSASPAASVAIARRPRGTERVTARAAASGMIPIEEPGELVGMAERTGHTAHDVTVDHHAGFARLARELLAHALQPREQQPDQRAADHDRELVTPPADHDDGEVQRARRDDAQKPRQ